jgi:hypothetical protein
MPNKVPPNCRPSGGIFIYCNLWQKKVTSHHVCESAQPCTHIDTKGWEVLKKISGTEGLVIRGQLVETSCPGIYLPGLRYEDDKTAGNEYLCPEHHGIIAWDKEDASKEVEEGSKGRKGEI